MTHYHRTHELFVPGRVCLFGEHSDWAGGYRRINSQLTPGQVIISGTNQGLWARVRAHKDHLIIRSVLPNGEEQKVELPMEREALHQVASEGGFFSYAAGVAYYMLSFYHVNGLEIDNYQTTLPVKKGLSSSAAFSVLVARAFNTVYDFKMTPRAELEAAYQGEIMTPSRCGRMDQGCAYGQVPVHMTFDGELMVTQLLSPQKPVELLIADLNGQKDTIRILSDLNRAYPFADDAPSKQIQEYLGPINERIVKEAGEAINAGDAQRLGALMTESQQLFDEYLMPACPSELTSPKLHAVLGDPCVQELIYGGKGVGSQGDGCVQFVVKSPLDREVLSAHLEQKYGMESFPLDIKTPQAVRKAVVPVAGFGTRMFPASKAVKKELFPVITPDGIAKPIILAIVEEAVAAGIEEIALIVREGDDEFFADFFNQQIDPENYNKLPERFKKYSHVLHDLGEKLTFISQSEQAGFGHAVNCAADWVGEEPFLLMLGDHLYVSDTDVPCARQLIDAFENKGANKSLVGVYVADAEEVSHYGTISGEWCAEDARTLNVKEFAEKPTQEYARENLATERLDEDQFLCIYGQYILTPDVFKHLKGQIVNDQREAGEIQLTSALETMRQDPGVLAYHVEGSHYDTGLPFPYVQTLGNVVKGPHRKS